MQSEEGEEQMQCNPNKQPDSDLPSPRSAEVCGDSGDSTKINIVLKPVGDAPIMKQRRWLVLRSRPLAWVNAFIRKYLNLDQKDSLFLYVNQSFCPSPDYTIDNLYSCFGSDGKLIINYSISEAWG
ncbi:unnamed protein product [Soboliphyme baturini]|uniref:Ubiquitin-like protein ATG12 n=1 Tax=Soboliphyme baturini TaxID=241478 RepID=A0A183J7Z9_9BILA|nr:unnamed protein product [Soboliphyme baturini]